MFLLPGINSKRNPENARLRNLIAQIINESIAKGRKRMGLRGIEWVKLYLLEHASQNLKPEIFFITKTVSSSLDNPDLVIQTLHKT